MAATAADRERFRAAVASARESLRDAPPVLDREGHERIALQAVEDNPELLERAWAAGELMPLVRAAERIAGDGEVSTFLLAEMVGKIVRGAA